MTFKFAIFCQWSITWFADMKQKTPFVYQKSIMYGSWDTEWGRQNFLSFWVIFCPFNTCPPPNDPENQHFEKKKWKKCLEILSFYTYMCTINEDHNDIWWFLKYKVEQTEIFVILGYSLPFQPPDNLGNHNFKIEKNTSRYYHFTHLHYKWQSCNAWFLRYGVLQRDFFVILDRFLPFYPLRTQKIKIFKIWKKHQKILSFYNNMYHKWQSNVLFLRYRV